jgi:hypothetical protein
MRWDCHNETGDRPTLNRKNEFKAPLEVQCRVLSTAGVALACTSSGSCNDGTIRSACLGVRNEIL